MACPALPTCSLAITESERILPTIISRIKNVLNLLDLSSEKIIIRMIKYKTFLLSPWADSIFISSYLGKKLVSVAVTDRLKDGLSAIYTFYDPYEAKRSLGTFNILNQVEIASELSLNYLYLGYWIANNQKMHYKINFKPLELFVNSEWTRIEKI